MKVTKRQLKRLIKEELQLALKEQRGLGPAWDPKIAHRAPSNAQCPHGHFPQGVGYDGVLICGKHPITPNPPLDSAPPLPQEAMDVGTPTRPSGVTPAHPPFETALPETEAAKRSAYDAQRDLDWAIKAYNFWGAQDPASEDFVNAQAAVETFRNEMMEMGVEPGSVEPFYGTPKKGTYQIGREPVLDPKTGKPYPRVPYN